MLSLFAAVFRRLGFPVAHGLLILALLNQLAPQCAASSGGKGRLQVQVLDSATGAALAPDKFSIRSHQPEAAQKERALGRKDFSEAGTAEVELEHGRHTLSAFAEGYSPVEGAFQMQPGNPHEARFLLDPIQEPEQTRPETIDALRLDNHMLIQGFISDGKSARLLEGVVVTDLKSGQTAVSDQVGFFRIYLSAAVEIKSSGALLVEKPGFRRLSIYNIEIWSRGDCTYKLRLNRGSGEELVDESTTRRRAPQISGEGTSAVPSADSETAASALSSSWQVAGSDIQPPQPATLPANATVRVPRNIRALQTNNVTVDYVSLTYYSRAVLGSEWIASWGDIAGGTNSLNAGAVAVRCYAISRINSATATSTYDICGTTSCQVYNPFKIHSRTDTAVNFTLDWVLLSGTSISGTEYSAENNAFGTTTFGCPDGFTEPDASCLYDPACAGQTRFGHGRGMCQWGTARWSTGRRMNGRVSSDATPNGYPLRDWKWLVQHYYPSLTFTKGASLVVGDDVKSLKTLDVRACPGTEITNGVNCALLTTKAAGSTGVILAGPITVTNDSKGFTWYKIDWSGTIGWSAENYIERVFSLPAAPSGLTATGIGTNQIQLTWTDNTDVEAGFEIERAISASGPWVEITNVTANTVTFVDSGLSMGNTWFYRVRAFNAGGASGYSGTANAQPIVSSPVIGSQSPATIPEEQPFSRTFTASAAELTSAFADFKPFPSENVVGTVLFRLPGFSGSTSANLLAAPNIAAVTDAFPASGLGVVKALRVRFAFTNIANPWLRLTTSGTANHPNPLIDLGKTLRFKVYADKSIGIAMGCRETGTVAGTPIGANGGATGGIEWVGVTNQSGAAPMPTRILGAGAWTTVSFNLPAEPARNFSSGNGVLASGLGVLEHIAIVPQAGVGEYNVYFADFEVVEPRFISWSLGGTAPTNMIIGSANGLLQWAPTEVQGPGSYSVPVIATASGSPARFATNLFAITVNEVNRAPSLTAIANRTVHSGALVAFTNIVSDPDLPANTIAFGLSAAPDGAQVHPSTGVFTWTTPSQSNATTNQMTMSAWDAGAPPLTNSQPFSIVVLPSPQMAVATPQPGLLTISWSAIPGTAYTVKYTDDLLAGPWNTLTNFVAPSEQIVLTNDTSANRRFFRLTSP